MKLRWQKQRNRAMTMVAVLVVVAVLIILVVMLLPVLAAAKRRASKINCVSNLKQVNLSFLIWAGDNNSKYPMAVSTSLGGVRESIELENTPSCFQVMSNELSTPRILVCPEDANRVSATNFDNDFNGSHISYFIGVDADKDHPQRILTGDDNFRINGNPVNSGLLSLSTNTPIEWGPGRHGDDPNRHFWTPPPKKFVGNIGFADGSVTAVSDDGLQESLILTDLATNRLAIP
jgi:prepilin-type processing-associated H-X9-DG protein